MNARTRVAVMIPTDADFDAMIAALRSCNRVLLTTHVRPDGDALGTTAAIAIGLSRLGIAAECLILSEVPDKYAFLYEGIIAHVLPQADVAALLAQADALLVCDTGTWSQLPGLESQLANFKGKRLVLDHHVTQEQWPDLHLVDTAAGAAAEVAFALLQRMDVLIDRPIAERLYAAIATDTGWFAYSNTSPRTLRIAADLVEAGASPDALFARLFRSERAAKIRLSARGLASLELIEVVGNEHIAVMTLSASDYAAAGAIVTDSEDLINEPMKIAGVEASLLIGENPQADVVEAGAVKASLRSKGKVDCAALMKTFGGGGHPRAAGARVPGTLTQAKAVLVNAVVNALRATAPAR